MHMMRILFIFFREFLLKFLYLLYIHYSFTVSFHRINALYAQQQRREIAFFFVKSL